MDKFIGNPDAAKKPEERRVLEPVTKDVKVKSSNNLASKLFAQDLKTTASGVANDVVFPGIKNLIVNIIKKAVDYLFLGTSYNNQSNGYGYTNYTSYGVPARNVSYSSGYSQQNQQRAETPTRSSIYQVNDVVFRERGEAEETITQMIGLCQRYGMVSVLDFYDLVGLKTNQQDNKYGWRDLATASVVRVPDGYSINFPKIVVLED